MFFTLFGFWGGRGGGGGFQGDWYTHNLLMQLFTLGSSKIEILDTFF